MIDYAENLCEAMKIILEKQIKQLSFDITIDATVVDATNAKNGMYIVSHDGATFTAYSTDSSFKEKDVVMVTIPQGNYNNQKMIIGKQVDKNKEEKPITYQSPFSQIINLSGNLVYGNIGEKSLLANGGLENPSEQESAQRILIKEFISDNTANLNDNQSILLEEYQTNGYTRLGLRADFSTWLNEFNVVSGNYGLILTLTFKNPDVVDSNNNNIQAIYTFDSNEFFGDIYNFETYYNQEAVFDISDYSDYFLQGIKLEAYQLDNFKTSDGTLLSYENMLSKPTDNIFVKEPFICLGTAVGEFKKDNIKIMTDSSSTYTSTEDEKDLKLKWIHQDLNSKDIYVVQEEEIPANYEIRWYKFKLGEKSPDEFMDAHWLRLEDENNKININFSPDPANQTEQVRAIVLKTENNNTTLVARSSIITFNNNKEVPNQANLELQKIDANALGIQFDDPENGNYYYYDKTGKIIQKEKSQKTRILKAVFDDNTNLENKKDLDQQAYTSIKWIFPKTNTMIIPLSPEGEDISVGSDVSNGYTVTTIKDDNYYEISFENQNGNTDKSILKEMKYRIDEYYSFNKSRNTIYLEVTINEQTYISSATMFFGMAGTSGSDYTIVVEWSEGIPVFDVNGDNDYSLNGNVKLLDLNGEPITLNNSAQYTYNFEENEIYTGLKVEVNNSNSSFKISKNNNTNNNSNIMNDLYLLEIKLTGFGDYDLISKYPIALKNNSNSIQINGITGTTIVRYASDGTIILDDKNPYSISFQEEKNGKYEEVEDKEVGRWKIHTNNNINHNFLPELIDINEDNSLIENFIQEIKNIKLNENPEITLLDLLISISNIEDSFNIDSLITSIKDTIIDDSIHHYPDSDNNINTFEENLLSVKKDKLKLLFNALEDKYIDYFSTVFFKKINPILSPPSVYFKDIPLYGVQYILNDDVTILYTQPIYVYQDNYPSGTLNKWNGKDLILNENNGTIIANGFSAGKKEDNNTFTGVMIGDWSRTKAEDSSISSTTGIYGFHQGAMSYAFTDDGKAFIGKDGGGRIEFDGNNGIIKSAGFIPSTENQHGYGTLIDLNEGKLQLYSPISDQDQNQPNQMEYYLTLSSIGTQKQPFLQISRKRNEVENFMSKYLNQYYNAYEDLKNYVTEVYNKLIEFAQAYITYQNYGYTISTGTQMSELIPYTYYIMTNFKENHEIDINNLNSLDKFPELKNNENYGINIVNNLWQFFYNSLEDDNLIDCEKNQYQILLQNFYNEPTLSNLSEVNIFIKTYIDKYEIEQFVQDSNIINYFFEDVSVLLPDNNESSNNNYDEYTQQKKLIKFIFNNSQEPLILGEKTGLTYYLYNFINFLPSPNTSFQKTTDSLENIEACITALNSLDLSTFYTEIKNSDPIAYEEADFNEYYHIMNGNDYYPANDFWEQNTYKKRENGTYLLIDEDDFPIYYLKVNNKYIRFKYYYSTLTPVDNTTNAEIKVHQNDQSFTREPILTFEKNKSYYYKDDNNEYIYTNYCDNNNKYFYTKYNSLDSSIVDGDYKNLVEFSSNIDYYELIKATSNNNYDANPYQKYQFDFISSVEEDDNLTETYVLKSFILPADTDQQVEREFKVGNGLTTLFNVNNYRSNDYTKVKIYTNQIYDITLRIDTKSQLSLGLTKDLWPIQGGFSVTEDGTTTTYYTSLSFTLRKNVFGKNLLDSLIQDKYSFLNISNQRYLKLISNNGLSRLKQGVYIQQIEEKINNLNAALRNVLKGVPSAKQSEYKENFSIRYSREDSETGKKSITLSLLTTNTIKIEKLKEYLKRDISNNFIFDVTSWENDLIKIINDGGYITSKDYRPTIMGGDKSARTPTQSQDSSSSEWRQGMKGFIIDLSNNRIVLGNNSQIEGVQSQYYPGQADVTHRYFIISTGVKFEPGQGVYSDRDTLDPKKGKDDKTYFIRAQASWTASKPSRDIFYIRWDGYVYCLSLRVQNNFYFGPHKVSSKSYSNLSSGDYVLCY